MKVVIFCGGEGTRLRDHTEIPKTLIKIGNKPVLVHIMEHYSYYGFNDFIVCLGYKGDMIKQYFLENKWRNSNLTISNGEVHHHDLKKDNWKITLVDTGKDSTKAERLKAVERFIKEGEDDRFFVSYGDDLSNVNLKKLLKFHENHHKIATLTTIRPINQYGIINFNDENPNEIKGFKEKPQMTEWINGGFFVLNTSIFDYINPGDELEKEVMEKLTKEKQLYAYKHQGFWKSMNTLKDVQELNELCDKGNTPWKEFECEVDSGETP